MKSIWTSAMYQYLSQLLSLEVFEICDWVEQEKKPLFRELEKLKKELTNQEVKIVVNRARRLADEYQEAVLADLEHERGYEEEVWFDRKITYDPAHYELWKEAVKMKKKVRLLYDSQSSGISERLVYPYKSDAPYGEGYCNTRRDVRKFRFDRVIDIQMTESTFVKKK